MVNWDDALKSCLEILEETDLKIWLFQKLLQCFDENGLPSELYNNLSLNKHK